MKNPQPQTISGSTPTINCAALPSLLSAFADTFVDFSVSGGLFLPPEPNPNPTKDQQSLQTFFPQPGRLVAIGDLHGDLPKAKEALRLAGLIGPDGRWAGGSATVVQVGDVFDRGGDEIKILYLLEKLRREAAAAGGEVITMNGNHEIMNVDGDFRFVARQGFEEFEEWGMWQGVGNGMKKMCGGVGEGVVVIEDLFRGVPKEVPGIKDEFVNGARARIAALRPNGLISRRFMAKNQTVVVVGDSVFAHGGLLEKHVHYGLERVNEEVRDWIRGEREKVASRLVRGRNSIVWLRSFSHESAKNCDCEALEHVLNTIPGAKRMIMGHTIQQGGINAVCGDRAVRIDVGMSKLCGGRYPEVLEINRESGMRILTSNPLYSGGVAERLMIDKKDDEIGFLIPEVGGSGQIEVYSWIQEFLDFYFFELNPITNC